MSLGVRMTLIILSGFLIAVTLVTLLVWLTILPGFERLEREAALRNVERVQRAVSKEAINLSTQVRDWASWDDTYQFVQDANLRYRDSNLVETAFTNLNLGVAIIIDARGKVVWSRVVDPGTLEPLSLSAFPPVTFPNDHPLLIPKEGGEVSGLLATEKGPMIVAASPILNSEATAPSRGTFIMGRFLDGAMETQFRENLSLELSFHPYSDAITTPEVEKARFDVVDEALRITTDLRDISDTPILQAVITMPRDIVNEGWRVLSFIIGGATASMALVSVLVWWNCNRAIIRPLTQVTQHITRIGQTGAMLEKLNEARADEFGVLAREINRTQDMLAQLIHYDPLTHLPNRPHFLEKAEQLLQLAKRHETQMAFLFIDLDNFKLVNDRLGHPTGDRVLIAFAERLTPCVRQTDAVCRCGGDEFLVAMADLHQLDDVDGICAKLITIVEEISPSPETKVSASIGVSLYPRDGDTVAELIARADAAMYQSKTKKSHYTFYQPTA
ncbi:MAG: hypothetical protein A2516_06040 [Alphaproteobacteria bacterium RIFOXYD12_FULL_60_8]|nr:MAG: hypothetical protein A2516_06040 [Alphaproteobacteria bacterium RIFOXYD12_FULL_60_8]